MVWRALKRKMQPLKEGDCVMTHTLRGLGCIQTTKISVYPTGHTTGEKSLTFRAKGLNGKDPVV